MPSLRAFAMLLGIFAFNTHAAPIDPYSRYLPTGTNVSIIVQPTGSLTPAMSHNAQAMMLPASTQKLITALAATLELGRDYRFVTTFESQGKINKGTLQGALVARFSGDPSLTRAQIKNMVAQLKAGGINRISGDLVIDTSIFGSHDRPSGWSWDNMTQCYSAPPSAAVIDQNCFMVKLETTEKSGDPIQVKVLPNYPISMNSEARSFAPKTPEARFCEFDVIAKDNNQFTLTGCITQQKKPITLSFAIQDSANYAGRVIKDELNKAGITLSGKIRQETVSSAKGKILAQTNSEPLDKLLTFMLKRSDNITADTIFRVLGHRYSGTPGTWRNGGIAVRQILSKKAGINLANTVIADGSGLSRQNLISAATMMQILQYVAANDSQLGLIDMLPISCQDGTLLGRKSLKDAGLDGMIHAKTGALSGVYNMAGFIQTANGKRLAFVQLISGYSAEGGGGKRSALNDFETHFYRDLYTNN
jgi:D-alanyl-D-alanine carboxypeptidase/D-alanyl-D-alanine-endopeptidase (penicillin-binding protein 4)